MMTRTFLSLLIVAALVGCGGVNKPRGEVVAIEPADVTDQGAVVNVTVLMMNPNGVELPVREVDYRVTLGDRVFDFTATPPVTLPVYDQQTFTLPAAFATGGAPIGGQPVRVTGRVYYQPPGKIREALTDMNVPLPHVAFESSTTLE